MWALRRRGPECRRYRPPLAGLGIPVGMNCESTLHHALPAVAMAPRIIVLAAEHGSIWSVPVEAEIRRRPSLVVPRSRRQSHRRARRDGRYFCAKSLVRSRNFGRSLFWIRCDECLIIFRKTK